MSFLAKGRDSPFGFGLINKVDPINRAASGFVADAFNKKPPAPPQVPNPNDAANAAQSLTDSMRMRRGLLSNLYAGSQTGPGSQPVAGKTTLGS
jgi:hypothetical protein